MLKIAPEPRKERAAQARRKWYKERMNEAGYHIFQTAFGVAGIAWRGGRIVAVSFPEDDRAAVETGLARRAEAARAVSPNPAIAKLCADIAALFAGGRPHFSDIEIDDRDAPDFERRVWALTRDIPIGETRTYGDIAKVIGDVAYSQRVGLALGRNPFPIIVPCHRVLGAGGAMTGFSAAGGVEAKRRLLKLEGALPLELFD